MKKVLSAAAIVLLFGCAGLVQANRPVPELSGKLDCGTLTGEGQIHILILGQYVGTMDLVCKKA